MKIRNEISRRAFVGAVAAVPLLGQINGGTPAGDDIPRVDLQAHISGAFTVAQAVALGQKLGVRLGIAISRADDRSMETFFQSVEGQPVWRGLEANLGSGWVDALSPANKARLDYIMSDALNFPYNGATVPIWSSKATFDDPQDFMEKLVEHTLNVIAQPINIWCNAAMLPASLVERYDELWTQQRMDRVIQAALKGNIAIEINAHWETPKASFVRRAKALSAKFSIGTDQRNDAIGQIDYSIKVAKECGLTAKDFYLPARDIGKQ
jgi:hypothetical protein